MSAAHKSVICDLQFDLCSCFLCPLPQMTSLEQVGEEVVGQARCPFESGQSNVGLFAGESTLTPVRHRRRSVAFLIENRIWFLFTYSVQTGCG